MESSSKQDSVSISKSYSEFILALEKTTHQNLQEVDFKKLPIYRWFAFLPKSENFTARTGHTAALLNKKIYLFSGVDDGGVSPLIFYFNSKKGSFK